MRKIVSVISGKGGSGKTTLSVNLASALTALGKRCLLIDCSFGVRNCDIPMGASDSVLYNLCDVLALEISPEDAVVQGNEEYIPDYIGASLKKTPADFKEKFSHLVTDGFGDYDFLVLDTPSSTGEELEACVEVSDIVLAVTTEEAFSVANTALVLSSSGDLSKKQVYTVINRAEHVPGYNPDGFYEDIVNETGYPLIGLIKEDSNVLSLLEKGDPIARYDTPAGREIENICKRICNIYVSPSKISLTEKLFDKNKLSLKQK